MPNKIPVLMFKVTVRLVIVLTFWLLTLIGLAVGWVATGVGRTCYHVPVDPYVVCVVSYSPTDLIALLGLALVLGVAVLAALWLGKILLVDVK